MRRLALSFLLVACPLVVQGERPSTDARIEALVSKMTLEEKLGQLTMSPPDDPVKIREAVERGEVGAVLGLRGTDRIDALQEAAVKGSRLGIPVLFANDVIHGYRTIFPIPLGIAGGWDPELAELAARVAAREARAAGTMWTFAPMVDIARDPRWGRMAEGAGEDPYLGSVMSAAYVHGFQGSSIGSDSVLACAKHYVAYGAAEGGRDYNTTDMSEATLREIYLPPFKAASDGAWTFMSAFNSLNGIPASGNRHTLTEILRDEWKFRGFVVSDWTAVAELVPHGIKATLTDASIKAISAGVDMDMSAGGYATLGAPVRAGRLRQSVVDAAVRRVLRAKFALGLKVSDGSLPIRVSALITNDGSRSRAGRRPADYECSIE